jgi:hypothetical protein
VALKPFSRLLLAGPDVGTSLVVLQLEKPLAVDRARKKEGLH